MASQKVTVRPCIVRGKVKWRVRRWEHGKPKRTFHDSKVKANAEASSLRHQVNSSGAAWVQLPPHERNNLMSLWNEAKKAGADLQQLFDDWKKGPKATLTGKAIEDVLTELLTAKKNAGRSEDYRSSLKLVIGHFIKGRESMAIEAFTVTDVERHLDSKSIHYRATLRARLSTLFRFAVRRGYRLDNPCDRLEAVTVTKPPPAIFTVMQTMRCLVWLRNNPRSLAWFILSTFCGLRPEEAEQMTWERINFSEKWLRIEDVTTKVRQRRIVNPKPQAIAWLKFAKDIGAELPLRSQPRRRAIRHLRTILRWKAWSKDVTRHTAASYWLADTQNADAISEQLGNSVKILKKHYKALVTRQEAKRFWLIRPPRRKGAARRLSDSPLLVGASVATEPHPVLHGDSTTAGTA